MRRTATVYIFLIDEIKEYLEETGQPLPRSMVEKMEEFFFVSEAVQFHKTVVRRWVVRAQQNDSSLEINPVLEMAPKLGFCFRIRKIPVVGLLSRMLHQTLPDEPETRFVQGFSTFHEYSRAVARELRKWDPTLKVKPKDLRNTLQTEAIDGGWYGYYVQRYVGHTPSTIGKLHYHGDEWTRILPFLQEKVVDRLEELIRSWNAPADTPVFRGLWLDPPQ